MSLKSTSHENSQLDSKQKQYSNSMVIAPQDSRMKNFVKINEELEQFMAMNSSKAMHSFTDYKGGNARSGNAKIGGIGVG